MIYSRDIRHWIALCESETRLAPFRTMTRQQFLGNPTITADRNASSLKPKLLVPLQNLPHVPFMDSLTAVYGEDGAAVFDDNEIIASYNFGDTLVVDRRFRRRGIGEELVYQWRTRFPNAIPAKQRTKASQRLQVKVWDRIQRELNSKPL